MDKFDRLVLSVTTIGLVVIGIFTVSGNFYFIFEIYGRIIFLILGIVFIIFMFKNGKEMDLW